MPSLVRRRSLFDTQRDTYKSLADRLLLKGRFGNLSSSHPMYDPQLKKSHDLFTATVQMGKLCS